MRYFYTDPLAAAWMAKHFGMKFYIKIYGALQKDFNDKYSEISDWENIMEEPLNGWGDYTYIVHPDSLHLLEPQVGDLVKHGDDFPVIVQSNEDYNEVYSRNMESTVHYCALEDFEGDKYEIIQRNGISFMWPEVENE